LLIAFGFKMTVEADFLFWKNEDVGPDFLESRERGRYDKKRR